MGRKLMICGVLGTLILIFSSCGLFRKKNRCGYCPAYSQAKNLKAIEKANPNSRYQNLEIEALNVVNE